MKISRKYTRYKQLRHIAYCFTTVDGTRRCYAIMPSLIRYLWSLQAKTLPDQPKLRCAPGSRHYRICHLNVVASHSFKRKQLSNYLSGGSRRKSGPMSAFCLKSQPWQKPTLRISPNGIQGTKMLEFIVFLPGLGDSASVESEWLLKELEWPFSGRKLMEIDKWCHPMDPTLSFGT